MIRLMTYNIRGTIGMDNGYSAKRVADVIRTSGAQIVCLQEVHTFREVSGNVDQPAVFGKMLGMHVAFQRNYRCGIGGLGNVVMTNLDFWQTRSHILTSDDEQRGVMEVQIISPEGPLTLFCTHLGLTDKERLTQTRELAALLNAASSPKLICGDFNEEAKDAGIRELIKSAGLVDSSPNGKPTFDAAKPSNRIDMVLCDPSIKVLATSVLSSEASDHLPLVVDLELPAK